MLRWYYYVMFGFVICVALVMTWWSMFDLGVNVLDPAVPDIVAAGASFIFDVAGLCLGIVAIEYAKTDDSGFLAELGTFVFIGVSIYIVSQHAILIDYPVVGVVMFASAPIVTGVLFKVTLQFISRRQRREAGRVTERLPSVGWFTWVRYLPQSFKLASVAMQGRIINAAHKLDMQPDKYQIFVGQPDKPKTSPEIVSETAENMSKTSVAVKDKKPQQLSQPIRQALTSPETMSLPVWLPHEPTMSLATLVRTCLDNGVLDLETMFRYAKDIKGQDVNKMSLSRTLARLKDTVK